MFYETVNKLCKERKTTITRMSEEIGLSNAAATSWKKGSVPKLSTLEKISEYFGVSVEFLLGKEQQKKPAPEVSGTGEDINATELLIQFCQKMGWLGENGDITADQADALISIIDLLEIIFKSKK